MRIVLILFLLSVFSAAAIAQEKASDSRHREIDSVLAHPLFRGNYVCSEHWAGQLESVGDDLGQDCLPAAFDSTTGFPKLYHGAGTKNEDWIGWQKAVLSPCTCKVLMVRLNETVNAPGSPGKPPASFILLSAAEGMSFVIAHIDSPLVKAGETVVAGQQIATVGNNGYGRMPHIHVGAWNGKDAFQIRWDQKKITEQ